MLYNEQWSKPKVTADVFSLGSLIAWLETMPGDQEYCFMDTGACLFFKYLDAMRIDVVGVGGGSYRRAIDSDQGVRHNFPSGWGLIAAETPHTFGAALSRARAASQAQS